LNQRARKPIPKNSLRFTLTNYARKPFCVNTQD
jgi:hypothetical protein